MLYRPAAHERLTDEVWDEGRVRTAIRGIVAEVDEAFDSRELWPADEWDAWKVQTPLTGLYVGAAGVCWALDALRRRGHAETRLELEAAGRRTLERWREAPELMEGVELPAAAEAGLFSGETGVLVVAWRVGGGGDIADALLRRVGSSRAS